MTTTQNPTTEPIVSLDYGNVLQVADRPTLTGSVTQTTEHGAHVHWSDGEESFERYPIVGLTFV